MKKRLAICLLAVMLAGCGAQETFETVDDLIPAEPVVAAQQFFVSLPDDTAAPTFQDGSGELYVSKDYTISKQVLESGDLEKTLKTLTGKEKSELQVIKTQQENFDRYDFVWTSAGEDGLQLGRACVLDDGHYHYALSAMAAEEAAGGLREKLQDMFSSCKLLDPELNLSTGS